MNHSALINSENTQIQVVWNVSHIFIYDVAWNILGQWGVVQAGTFHNNDVKNSLLMLLFCYSTSVLMLGV